ncbi:MAG: ATP synthase F1 subunit gamma [Oscillospiraceae bacterium]
MAGVSMKDIKLRIRSMESTKQITKAMEMVAASKLRRAQENVLRSRPYFEVLYSAITDIASNNSEFTSPYVCEREVKKSCYIVIAGDRGLAGGYNHNILKLAEETMSGKNAVVMPIGKKSLENFRAHGYEILSEAYPEAGALSISDCFTMARGLCKDFSEGEFDEVYIAYTNFASMLVQTPCVMQLLPLKCGEERSGAPHSITLYEPDSETVFNRIIPEYLGGLIYGALRESIASEQGARRTAMDAATKNAEEMIDDLSLKYNRARQGAITQEITEIVAGADA